MIMIGMTMIIYSLLRFKEGNKRLFFWMQEPESKKDKDEDLMKKVNKRTDYFGDTIIILIYR